MPTKQVNPHEELKIAMSRLIGSNRFIFSFLGISMLVMFVFGPWIYFIAVGLLWGFWIISMTFNSPYQLIMRVFRLKGMPEHLPKPNASTTISNLVSLIFAAYLVYLGIKTLVFFGSFSPLLIFAETIPFIFSD
jgi:hypothetical protein